MLHYFLGTIEEIDQTETYLTRSRKQPFSDAGNVGLSSFWAVNDSLPICLLPSEVTGAHSVLLEKVVTGGGGVPPAAVRTGDGRPGGPLSGKAVSWFSPALRRAERSRWCALGPLSRRRVCYVFEQLVHLQSTLEIRVIR